MAFTLCELTNDIRNLDVQMIYNKYILSDDNWYFENVLSVSSGRISEIATEFNSIISNGFNIDQAHIRMVGSGKIGYSLTPPSDKPELASKCFKPFCVDGKGRKTSDIDIVIISECLFEFFWGLLRKSYKFKYNALYEYIPTAVYRGYINENHLQKIDGCRKDWNAISITSKKELHSNLFVQHDINYHLYRKWDDFEDYHLQGLRKIKRGVCDGSIIS